MRQTAIVVSATAAVVALAALAVFLWLRAYAPLDARGPFAPGPGLSADVEPTFGSGGKPVLVPAYRRGRSFETTVTVHNGGRFAVTLTGIEDERGALAAGGPIHDLRLSPHDSASIVVDWRLACAGGGQFSRDAVRLRYRYLSLFRRTATVELPFAVTLRCPEGAPASP